MRIKRELAKPLVILLAASQCVTSFAGTWTNRTATEWVYQLDDGTYQKAGWFQDPTTGKWYYLNENGIMDYGWKQIDGIWYFFNTVHDGTFGARISNGWYWIDGYCYYFSDDGKLFVNGTTPDGFTVNQAGQWTENGTAVYSVGKGITTSEGLGEGAALPVSKKTSSGSKGSGGSGGGGGGGGGSSSSSYVYYDYTITYVDEDGHLLTSVEGEAKKNSFITVTIKEFDGYEFLDGPSGSQKLTFDQAVFVIRYKKIEKAPEKPKEEADFSYTIIYKDSDTDHVIKKEQGSGKPGSVISIPQGPAGYVTLGDNPSSFTISGDNTEIVLYYTKKKSVFRYKIRYVGDDGKALGSITGEAVEESIVSIPVRSFEGYTIEDGQDDEFTIHSDNQTVTVSYVKDIPDDEATPSEPEEETCSYTIKYVDKDSMGLLSKENGTAFKGDVIVPDIEIEGYEYASDYEFTIEADGDTFTVYLVKLKDDVIEKETSYTVVCVDENGEKIRAFEGTVTVVDEPVVIYPDYEIEGYERIGDNEFFVSAEGSNSFILEYASIKKYDFIIECMDIDSLTAIEKVVLHGNAGDELDISGICPAGYEIIGMPPESVTVSANKENNAIRIYYKKITDHPAEEKEAAYTIRFRAYRDNDTVVLNDLTGTWTVGEKIPVYFLRELTDTKGSKWQAVGDSPRIFTVRDQAMNMFLIEYRLVGEDEKTENERVYSIRYIAEDTGSVLGITTGIAQAGDIIPYRNTFEGYGFMENENSYTITSDDVNGIDVIMKRVLFPGHEVNGSTGLFDGFEWTALFVDSNGNQLLPDYSGFTVKGDDFYIDYPDVIEKDGVTYRAAENSPYKCLADGTVYRQFIIQYITGDASEEKLEKWKNKAQEKKDEFYGTKPYSYYVAYREKNSWNDIALKFGVANAGSTVNVECEEVEGWNVPQENLGSFVLDQNGIKTYAQYEKPNGGTSSGYNKRSYTVHFTDTEGKDLFDSYDGYLAFIKGNSSCDFTVYYPDSFYDAEGNRWEADELSPQSFVMSAMDENQKYVKYHQVYENEKEQYIVESNKDVNQILNDFATHTYDSGRHEFYLIGRDYNPGTAEVSSTMYANNLAGYTNEVVDTFTLNGVSYTVSLVGYYRKWEQETCTHEWEYAEALEGNCQTAESRIVRCSKCGKEVTTISPAVGHVDEDYDGKCDVCGSQLKQNLGDEIAVTWNSGSLGFGSIQYHFVCIDTDYKGTGHMLYVCEDDILSDVYGKYTESGSSDYNSSSVRYFLDDKFADGLSISTLLQSIDGDAVSMLTKEEYDAYRTASVNNFPFPSGTFLTKGDDMDYVTLTDGRAISKEEAENYPIRPTILLKRSEEEEGTRTGIWKVGDMQARELDGKLYLFRCVDANYTDKSNTDKSLALFLCDTVIPANAGLGFSEADGTQSTRFFGDTNNYKYSTINDWLTSGKTKTGNLIMTNIGILNEYAGATEKGKFQSLDARSLTRFTRDKAQVMYSNLFIPSVEEAIAMKDYLWKFNGSDKNNAADIINNYCESYWLRTPQYGTEDMIYTVNLKTGVIEPKSVKATDGNAVSNTGIRPMYIVEQAY